MRRRSLTTLLVTVALSLLGFASTFVFSKHPTLGLDLQGGASVVLSPQGDFTTEGVEQAKRIIRNRVDGLGVGEPEIIRQGNAIVVNLPGVKDQDKALETVGQTAELRFRPVLEILPAAESEPVVQLAPTTTVAGATTTAAPDGATTTAAAAAAPTTAGATTTEGPTPGKSRPLSAATTVPATTASATTGAATTGPATTTAAAAGGATTTAAGGATTTAAGAASTSPVVTISEPIASTKPEDDKADAEVVLPQKDKNGKVTARYRLGPAFLTGSGVSTARTDYNSQNLEYVVSLELKGGAEGIDAFNAMAAQCFAGTSPSCPPVDGGGKGAIAIVLDSVVQSAPRIQAQSFTKDQIQISGSFTQDSAERLSLVLRYGALPVKLVPQAVQTVSATLGKDSLRAGVIAGVIGVILVLLFMLFYYRAMALVVFAGLVVSSLILWTIVSWADATLTLSGATGIIVSIGVTVDSYVVFFERLKDDVRAGRTLRSSAGRGFASAWRTIVAADVVSLIGALVLYYLTVGSVRGFAFFLGLSTAVDLVVAYFFTRPAVRYLSLTNLFKGDKVLGVAAGEALVAGGAA